MQSAMRWFSEGLARLLYCKRQDQTMVPYNYRPAGAQQQNRRGDSVEHPDQAEMFRARQSANALGLAEEELRHDGLRT